MNKSKKMIIAAVISLLLTGCAGALETAQAAVDSYNSVLADYNSRSADYTAAVEKIAEENSSLEEALDEAQSLLNTGDEPFDPETETRLKDQITAAENARIDQPEALPHYEELTVDVNADKATLKTLTKQADDDAKAISEIEVPSEIPDVPDISNDIDSLEKAASKYKDSVQSMKQITAPFDDFVMDRLRRVDTITAMDHVTEDHDPNQSLNKQGGYIGTVYFSDSEVDRAANYIKNTDVIDAGCNGGGAVEIFPDTDTAEKRNSYLGALDGTGIGYSGSHQVYGTCVIRTSRYLTATQQNELTQKIVDALTVIY